MPPKCPLLVELTLINCDNLVEFTVPHLNYLEKVHVNSRKKIKKLEVKAQNLLEIHLCCPTFTKLIRVFLMYCTLVHTFTPVVLSFQGPNFQQKFSIQASYTQFPFALIPLWDAGF